DPSTGEECEGATGCAGGPACDPTACRCVATSTTIPAGNHRPSASGVSLRADLVLPYVEQPLIATDPDGDTLTYELLSPAQGPGFPAGLGEPALGTVLSHHRAGVPRPDRPLVPRYGRAAVQRARRYLDRRAVVPGPAGNRGEPRGSR